MPEHITKLVHKRTIESYKKMTPYALTA